MLRGDWLEEVEESRAIQGVYSNAWVCESNQKDAPFDGPCKGSREDSCTESLVQGVVGTVGTQEIDSFESIVRGSDPAVVVVESSIYERVVEARDSIEAVESIGNRAPGEDDESVVNSSKQKIPSAVQVTYTRIASQGDVLNGVHQILIVCLNQNEEDSDDSHFGKWWKWHIQ